MQATSTLNTLLHLSSAKKLQIQLPHAWSTIFFSISADQPSDEGRHPHEHQGWSRNLGMSSIISFSTKINFRGRRLINYILYFGRGQAREDTWLPAKIPLEIHGLKAS